MEKIKKNDFIELKFTGKLADGEIFDTNLKEDAEKIDLKLDEKKFVICVGQKMVVTGLDDALIDKEINKKYSIQVKTKDAFGDRSRDKVKLIPLNVFTEQKIRPEPGMTLHLDNHLVRIASVSGGRVLVDFNNPLAGKDVIYDFTIKEKITDINDKINALQDYFMKKRLPFDLKDGKAIFEADKFFGSMISILNDKFKDILGIELTIKETKETESKTPQ